MEARPATNRIVTAGNSDIGIDRKHNEDAVLMRPDLRLYLVADGAGGHGAGNVASTLALASVVRFFEETEGATRERSEVDAFGLYTSARRLSAAVHRANREIIDISKRSNKYRGMGTTIVAVCFSPDARLMHLAYVGDSRCYRLRAGILEQLTWDHSLINEVLEMRPELPDEEVARLPAQVVTRALGMDEHVRALVRTHETMPGDRYLLSTDGLHGALEPDEIIDVLRSSLSADEQVARLISMAKHAGSKDNLAAVVICCEGAPLPSRLLRNTPVPMQRPPKPYEATPEIMVVNEDPTSQSEHFHVVPPQSADRKLIDAVDLVMRPRLRTNPPPPKDPE